MADRAPKSDLWQSLAISCYKQHNACMSKSITIRDVPDETARELAARASASGRSLQEYLRAHLIVWCTQPEPAVLMARARARKERAGAEVGSASILSHRDSDRR